MVINLKNLIQLKASTSRNKMSEIILNIRELDLDTIQPNNSTFMNEDQGGSKIIIIGKPGTGKSTIIKSLLYAKRNIFPCGVVFSGTEDSSSYFLKMFPSLFIHGGYDEDQLTKFVQRQKIARKHLSNPWCLCILDDCTDDPAKLARPLQQGLFKNGRHWKMLYLLSLQYSLDVRPAIRTSVDGIFILREVNAINRKNLWDNYGGVVPDFKQFCTILDQVNDDFTALYIKNTGNSSKIEDCLFWYKAPLDIPENFRFGSDDYWKFSKVRFNEDFVEPLI